VDGLDDPYLDATILNPRATDEDIQDVDHRNAEHLELAVSDLAL
jgi:hypothetical protein